MFEKTIVRGLFAVALVVATMLAGTAMAEVVLPTGLAPGSQYQIAFVTADRTSGSSGSETYYNNFVSAEAAPLTAILPSGTTWRAITSTYDGTNYYNAVDNAATLSGVPIYNTKGQLVATGTGLWGGSLHALLEYDQTGDAIVDTGYPAVWTGTSGTGNTGDAVPGHALGQSYPEVAVPFTTAWWWLGSGAGAYSTSAYMSVYALSSPITVASVPEPSTVVLLGIGAVSLLAYAWRRR
jgi:hypothetical protein